jgi:deoxyadenosine/deoxycytidine kinase
MSHYIVIEGVIGVGKTTLTRILARALDADSVLEAVEQNPFLSDFYADRARYAFQTETFFLLSRFRQQTGTVAQSIAQRNLVSDYLFAKNAIFARLNLHGDELALFEQLYGTLGDRVPKPDLVVYLQADIDTLLARIALRDRAFERNMERHYIADLHAAYEAFFASYTDTPMLTVATDMLDVVRSTQARANILSRIDVALAGYQQLTLDV